MKLYDSSSDEESMDELVEYQDDDDDLLEDEICGEFGRNNEIWFQCIMCGKWSHKDQWCGYTKELYM